MTAPRPVYRLLPALWTSDGCPRDEHACRTTSRPRSYTNRPSDPFVSLLEEADDSSASNPTDASSLRSAPTRLAATVVVTLVAALGSPHSGTRTGRSCNLSTTRLHPIQSCSTTSRSASCPFAGVPGLRISGTVPLVQNSLPIVTAARHTRRALGQRPGKWSRLPVGWQGNRLLRIRAE